MSYMTLSSQEQPLFQKRINSFMTLFLLCSYFRAHPTTLLLKILEERMHGPSPISNLGGPSPQSPLGIRPWSYYTEVHEYSGKQSAVVNALIFSKSLT